MDETKAKNISPSNEEVSLEDFGRGEDYKFKTTCVNDFLVSGAAATFAVDFFGVVLGAAAFLAN